MDVRSLSLVRRAGVCCLLAGIACLLAVAPAGSLEPKQPGSYLGAKEFFLPELYISTSNEALEEILPLLPNRGAWETFRTSVAASTPGGVRAFIDPRSGAATNIVGAFPLIPGKGVGNKVGLADLGTRLGRKVDRVDGAAVADAVLGFVRSHQGILGIDIGQLGTPVASQVTPELWQVAIPQTYLGVPVRYGRLVATINNGNLVLIGTETWGDVKGLAPQAQVPADKALDAGFSHAGGRSQLDVVVRRPALEVIPTAPPEHQVGEAFGGPLGAGYRHRLAWTWTFVRPPEPEVWEVIVDAHSGELLAFQDTNHYTTEQITGGVYPVTSTEVCPTPQTCGTMQSDYPMPFADTGLPSPNNFTNSAGLFEYSGGTVNTNLEGLFVEVNDNCGTISNSSSTGSLDLGGSNGQHDCTSGGGSPGNTASSRSAFYEVNKIIELARGWLPSNGWLQSQLTANVNLNQTCNAFYSGSINFFQSGGGCRNTGEIAGVFDHEWGHGMDDNDAGGFFSSTSEAYADIAAIYRLHASCVGHGFFWTSNRGCGQTADGTGFNANEAQTGPSHCNLDCSGVRDADWDKHADHNPDTALGFVCNSCNSGGAPCGRQVHCAAAPPRQAAWDLVTRDLAAAPFNLDRQTAFIVGNKLFYQGSGNIGNWYSCSCGSSSSGCGSTNAYMQWLAADDDDGNINDGTPHMTAIHAAFDRHGIACSSPTPVNNGCGGGPSTAPTVSGTAGGHQASLSWSSVSGASRYWVFRTEGHAGCDFGKALIAEVTGTSYVDTGLAAGRDYHYNVVAAGSSSACFSPASSCVTVTPTADDDPPPPPPPPGDCLHDVDFESGAGGWIQGSSSCSTGHFVVGSPDPESNGGVVTQVSGGSGSVNAFFTAPNPGGAGTDDVDNGTCEALSPNVDASAEDAVEVSLDYFHGQRDAGDDPSDGFTIEVLNNGSPVATLASFGDVTNNAAWTPASVIVANPGTIRLRVRATDGAGPGDLVEGGVDNVQICPSDDEPPPPPTCTVEDDFESGAAGWSNSPSSTCSTGDYVLGTPTQQSNGGVITQVGGAQSGANALFTAFNSSVGGDDVDGGNCILDSPSWSVSESSTLSVWYFHGQRDAGDDPGGDFFLLEYSTDNGASWNTLASNGDSTSNAAWANATASIPAGSSVRLRVQCSDGSGPGDLVECGIDTLSICSG